LTATKSLTGCLKTAAGAHTLHSYNELNLSN